MNRLLKAFLPEQHSQLPDQTGDAVQVQIPEFYLPPRFQSAVQKYAVGLVTRGRHPKTFRSPALLIIEGPPGEGKSRMARESLAVLGIKKTSPLPPATMSGPFESDSSKPFLDELHRLGNRDENPGDVPGCMFLDDYDLSVGRQDETVYSTTNSGLLNSALMSYADDPLTVRFRDAKTEVEQAYPIKPVLVVLTINDSGALYPPLRRAGRAMRFTWVPTAEEKASMIGGLFGGLSGQERARLIKRHSRQPIAFYEAVMLDMVQKGIEAQHGSVRLEHVFSPSLSQKLNEWVVHIRTQANYPEIVKTADRLRADFDVKSHVGN